MTTDPTFHRSGTVPDWRRLVIDAVERVLEIADFQRSKLGILFDHEETNERLGRSRRSSQIPKFSQGFAHRVESQLGGIYFR